MSDKDLENIEPIKDGHGRRMAGAINEKSSSNPWPPGYGNGAYDDREADVNHGRLESASMFPPGNDLEPMPTFPDPNFGKDLKQVHSHIRGDSIPDGGGGIPEFLNVEKDKNTQPFKETNPKDAVGIQKWRQYSTVPTTVIWELGVAMLEGARKYGRHNYRVAGVRGSVYLDAAKGHMDTWWEGEDIDKDCGLNHIIKAIASLTVMRDAMIQGKFVDDRPPKTDLESFRASMQTAVDDIFKRIPKAKDAYLEGDQYDK